MAVSAAEYLNANHFTMAASTHTLGGIADFLGLFAEDSAQKPLFTRKFLFTFRGNFTN